MSGPSGIQAAEGKGLGVVFGDINDDGRIDISVANDSVPQFLFQNQGDGTFSEIAMTAGVALDEDGQDFGGMGTDLGDLNGDGLPEILTTTISLQRYAYYLNLGDSMFDYETVRSTLGTITHSCTGWGMKFLTSITMATKTCFLRAATLWTISSGRTPRSDICSRLCCFGTATGGLRTCQSSPGRLSSARGRAVVPPSALET